LTRILKEKWLFGKLQTVGTSEAEKRAEAAAAKVAGGLARLNSGAKPLPSSMQSGEVNGRLGESIENTRDHWYNQI